MFEMFLGEIAGLPRRTSYSARFQHVANSIQLKVNTALCRTRSGDGDRAYSTRF